MSSASIRSAPDTLRYARWERAVPVYGFPVVNRFFLVLVAMTLLAFLLTAYRELAGLGGEVKVPLPAGATPRQLAAWTAVSRVILNLDETITKE